jgi:hypothetical protein
MSATAPDATATIDAISVKQSRTGKRRLRWAVGNDRGHT